MQKITKTHLKHLTYQFNGACIEVHKALGPGLLESVYHKCLKHELRSRNISFESEIPVSVLYKGIALETELRCDFLIEKVLVAEIKAVEKIHPIHQAQVLTYMQLLHIPKGILVNFNVTNLYTEGQKTFVNQHFNELLE